MIQLNEVTIALRGGIVYIINKTDPNIKVTIMDYDIDHDDPQASTDKYGNKCIISID